MRLKPGFQLLIASRFCVSIGTSSQHRNKQRSRPGLPARAVAIADSVRKTSCSNTLRDGLADIPPTQLQGQMAMLLQLLMNGFPVGCGRCCTAFSLAGWLANNLGSSSSSSKPSGNGQPMPAAAALSRYL
jgi:hypothetical protein